MAMICNYPGNFRAQRVGFRVNHCEQVNFITMKIHLKKDGLREKQELPSKLTKNLFRQLNHRSENQTYYRIMATGDDTTQL